MMLNMTELELLQRLACVVESPASMPINICSNEVKLCRWAPTGRMTQRLSVRPFYLSYMFKWPNHADHRGTRC